MKRRRPRPWRFLRWGVVFTSGDGRSVLIGRLWADWDQWPPYEPGRALLFDRRRLARQWVADRNAKNAARPVGDICRSWRFRVVRVRESVTVCRGRS